VITRCRDEESFGSESFAHGHRAAAEGQGGSAPQPVARHSEMWFYIVVADPIPVELRGPLGPAGRGSPSGTYRDFARRRGARWANRCNRWIVDRCCCLGSGSPSLELVKGASGSPGWARGWSEGDG
jgi:hypothetical protein